MAKNVLICAAVILPLLFAGCSSKSYKIVCYLGSWAYYRTGEGKFVVEDIDPYLCTHLIYGFAKLGDDNKITPYDTYLDLKENYGLGAYDRFNNLKKKNPDLKTLIAIGGWNEGSTKYSRMAADPSTRKTFVDSCVQFLLEHKFNGLDLDWEYPANRGGKPEDKMNFVSLIKELREAVQQYGFLLTAAVGAGQSTIDTAYDVPALGKYLDFINLMTYDFHGSWDKYTGHNAPLYDEDKNNVDYAVKYWLSKGAPADKIILGMGTYGRGFKLQDPNNNGLGAPASGSSSAGEITKQPGMLGYNEICKMVKQNDWNIVFDTKIQAVYAYRGNEWIGYDNPQSISEKVKYLKKMNLGGSMIWSLETDDFRGKCHDTRFPLLGTIKKSLSGETSPETENTIPTESRPETTPSTESNNNDELPCPANGYYRHPKNCRKFYYCERNANGEDRFYMFTCAEGTVYSQRAGVCDFPDNVPECR